MKLYIEKLMIIFNREFTGYFRTPLASIFLLVFLALSAGMTFFMGQFFQRGQADLNSFSSHLLLLYLHLSYHFYQ